MAFGFMNQIKRIVYVMFENRSVDNLLGWLYESNRPDNMVPTSLSPQYDGLQTGNYRLPLKTFWSPHPTWHDIVRGVGGDGMTVPSLDPNEEYESVLNQLFGDALTTVHSEPKDRRVAPMLGFLQDFNGALESWQQALEITKTYTDQELRIIHGLARQYAISDRWYCSMPTQTNPNRAFALCGTSLGRLVNVHWTAWESFDTPTIWNALAERNTLQMSLFCFDDDWAYSGKCYTQYTFPHMADVIATGQLKVAKYDDPINGFRKQVAAGNLPAFTYIEPKWSYGDGRILKTQGNDYHPPGNVTCGEWLLYDIYTALVSNAHTWNETLLIVTFDEHGGTYDHHPPPWGAKHPGDPASNAQTDFDFELYGVRVPTLLISPYIKKSTVFRAPMTLPQYDHTSILATLLKWQGLDPTKKGAKYLWDRVAVAPTFEGVLQDTIVNTGVTLPPQTECTYESTVVSGGTADFLEGLPVAARRYIADRARDIEAAKTMADDWRAHNRQT